MKIVIAFLAGMAFTYILMYGIAKIAMMDIPETAWKYEP